MPHGLADGSHGNILALGDARPSVTRHVGGERHGQAEFPADYFQIAVYAVRLVHILGPLVLTVASDDGKQVGRAGGVVLPDFVIASP